MPLKDIREPDASKNGATGDPNSDRETNAASAWKTDPDTGKRTRQGRKLPFEIKLAELLSGASLLAGMAGDSFVAAAIDTRTEELAYGYAKLAQSDERVKRVLNMLLTGSAWSEAIAPTVGLAIVVGWHYKVVPDKLGVPFTIASGIVPVSREQEQEMKLRARAQQAQEQAADSEAAAAAQAAAASPTQDPDAAASSD